MTVRQRIRLLLFLIAVVAVGCESDAPPNPLGPTSTTVPPSTPPNTPPTTPEASPPIPPGTRILRLIGKSGEPVLDYGKVEVGEEKSQRFLVCNDGNEMVAIDGITASDGFYSDWGPYYSPNLVPPGRCEEFDSGFVPTKIGRYEGSLVVEAKYTGGNNTIPVRGTGAAPPGPPLTVFGEGTYVIGLVVAPGRYHANPNGRCTWWRLSRYPWKEESDLIVEIQTWFDPGHWIVDILPSDAAFASGRGCGWWDQWPGNSPAAATIPHGVWEVSRQIQPGRYTTQAQPGCHWERLRNFQWRREGVIEEQDSNAESAIFVDILRSDAGFLTSPQCGVWSRTQ